VRIKEPKGWIRPLPLWDGTDGKAYLDMPWPRSPPLMTACLIVSSLSAVAPSCCTGGTLVLTVTRRPYRRGSEKFYKRNWYYSIFCAGPEGWPPARATVLPLEKVYAPTMGRSVLCPGQDAEFNGPHPGRVGRYFTAGDAWFLHFQGQGAYGRVVRSRAE